MLPAWMCGLKSSDDFKSVVNVFNQLNLEFHVCWEPA